MMSAETAVPSAYFLELEGGLFIGWCILSVLCTFVFKDWTVATVFALSLGPLNLIPAVVGLISEISIFVWGSVVIFGKSHAKQCSTILVNNYLLILGSYAEWTHEDPDNENYCPYLPFMFSFVLLIVKCLLFPFFCLALIIIKREVF